VQKKKNWKSNFVPVSTALSPKTVSRSVCRRFILYRDYARWKM